MARSLSLLRRRPNLVDLGVRRRASVASYDVQVATNFDAVFTDLASFPAAGKMSASVVESASDRGSHRGWSRLVFSPSDYLTVVGTAIGGQTGVVATVGAVSGEVVTIGGLTGMTADSVRRYLTLSGCATAGNNGTFRIVAYVSATSVKVLNPAGTTPDANSGAITWTEKTATPGIDTAPMYLRIRQVGTDGAVGAWEAMHLVLPYSTVSDRAFILSGTAPSGTGVGDALEIQLPGQCFSPEFLATGATTVQVAFEPGGPEFTVPIAASGVALNPPFANYTQLFVRGPGSTAGFTAAMSLRGSSR